MSANLLEIYESAGGYAKAGAEQAAAATARIAEVVRDGGLLLAEGVVYHVSHSTQALGAVVKSRSPEELAAAQREWLEGAINRAAADFKAGLDLTGRLLSETAPAAVVAPTIVAPAVVAPAPVAVEAVAPAVVIEAAPVSVVEEAPAVEAAPVVEEAPVVDEEPVAEAAPIVEAAAPVVEETAPVTEEIAAESASASTEIVADAPAAPVAEASSASKARGPRRGRAAKAEGSVAAAE
ncbi:MAG TPA: hypothetical protein PKZ97_08225 [Azospirillaceae bacterium]|nr:hypothetical protein [Azospirillaceae bacterium]HRQ81091.1 hypothetical protein [Azospirillaceae bacterium]